MWSSTLRFQLSKNVTVIDDPPIKEYDSNRECVLSKNITVIDDRSIKEYDSNDKTALFRNITATIGILSQMIQINFNLK